MLTPGDYQALWLTLELAAVTTIVLLLIGLPLAWWLALSRGAWKPWAEAVVALPLVLPPTVLGFYLLIAFAPDAAAGQLWHTLTGERLAFSFSALVIGSVLYSLPFVVQPLQAGFEQLPRPTLEAAKTLGAGPLDRFLTVVLPLCRRQLITAATLGFAHTVGEFGVVLMIGGNIPGETQVLSIALYDHVETQAFTQAHTLAALLLVFSLAVLALTYRYNRRGMAVDRVGTH